MRYKPIKPDLQISFYYRLKLVRDVYLQKALSNTVMQMEISVIDKELSEYVSLSILQKIASFGIRGEVFIPVPCIIKKNPRLIGYYRLLYGLSQKEFYTKGPFNRFKKMEISVKKLSIINEDIIELCKSLIHTGQKLIDGLDNLSISVAHDLQLLTLGPQFRGSRNTDLGKAATEKTFSLIVDMINNYIISSDKNRITIINDSKREVSILFSSDPDISIIEKFTKSCRNLVSIEIKGGTDYSNIHNRLGEAEKSHQKAKNRGFSEFWTILGVNVDYSIAKKESPTTTHFFNLDKIYNKYSDEYESFKNNISSILSIRI